MVYLISADVTINNVMAVEANSESEARAKASAMLFTILDEKTMFPYESVVLEAGVEAVEVMASDEYEGDPGDFFDDEYEPPEYFSD